MLKKLKPWAVNMSLALGGLVAAISIVEIGLRFLGISYPNFYASDEYAGTRHRPGVSGFYRKEGESYIKINSEGLRDREHSKEKAENTIRIAVLGDSYAEAFQVPMEKAFWAVMEKQLSGCQAFGSKKVEAINFGVSGHGTAQELMTLRDRVWDYSPDIVVLAFLTGNDIRNNSRTLEQDEARPYFIYRNGDLVLDASFLESNTYRKRQSWQWKLGYRIINYSRVLQVINEVKNIMHQQKLARKKEKKADSESANAEVGIDSNIYKEPTDPAWQEAWRVTEGLLVLMRDEVRAKGAEFLAVTLSNGIQVHPDPLTRQAYMEQLGISDLFYPDLRIKNLGKREEFKVLNLAQPLQAYAEKNKVCLHGFANAVPCGGHWNAEGHRVAGEAIAKKLCDIAQ